MKKRAGFTLIEMVVALQIFALITVSVSSALMYASNASTKLRVKSELFENARIAMDFMSVHLKAAEKVEFSLSQDGRLKKLVVQHRESDNTLKTHEFTYATNVSTSSPHYHRLEFGGNELASYIADIQVQLDGNLLTLKIVTDKEVNYLSAALAEPIVLTSKMKLYNLR